MDAIFNELSEKRTKLSVTGLGYVGLPLAIAFDKHFSVVGYDVDATKIDKYLAGVDPTREVGDASIAASNIEFTTDARVLSQAKFHVITVPTPIKDDKTPDLSLLREATRIVGENLRKQSVVVIESTVYPGVTEDICVAILEKCSGLVCGKDFKIAYSPERINPGDKTHRLETITKVVSGMDEETTSVVSKVYGRIIDAGIFQAESIRVAEAAKIIENIQRDINIALMNELSVIFNRMRIDTKDVLEAAGTKWNFLHFVPGLVGGHCIGVDPYYLTYKAKELGYHPEVILSGRRINDDMGRYVAEILIKRLMKSGSFVSGFSVGILGFTFKEDCPDVRNTRVIDIVTELEEYGITPKVADPVADPAAAEAEYGLHLTQMEDIREMDAIIVAVGHQCFKDIPLENLEEMFQKKEENQKILFDLKGIYDKKEMESRNFHYWRL